MRDSPSNQQAASVTDAALDPETRCDAERERLIDDLVFLVVRQHQHHQRAKSDNDLTSASVEFEPK
jgi:hypothetical protein